MLKIDKAVQIAIDGDDVRTLKDICEMARRYIAANKGSDLGRDFPYVAEFSTFEVHQVESMLESIFGA